LGCDLRVAQREGRRGHLPGSALLHAGRAEASILDLTVALGSASWRLQSAATGAGDGFAAGHSPATMSWSDDGVAISPLVFADADGAQRIRVAGPGGGAAGGAAPRSPGP